MALDNTKRGPLSKDQLDFFLKNMQSVSDADLSKVLGRSTKYIAKLRTKHAGTYVAKETDGEAAALKRDLYSKYYWPTITRQFTETEQIYFADMWVHLCRQMTDLVETEENQVIDYIKLDILKNRNLEERAASHKRVEEIEAEVHEFHKHHGPPPYDGSPELCEEYAKLQEERKAHAMTFEHRTNEFKQILEKQESLRKALRANRDQRIQVINDSKKTFQDLIKMLMDDRLREKEGKFLSMMHDAADIENARLGQPYQYADGEIDIPILNVETVKRFKDTQEKEDTDESNESEE